MKTNCIYRVLFSGMLFLCFAACGGAAIAAGPGVHGRVFGHDEQGKLIGVVSSAKIEFLNASQTVVATTASEKDGYYIVELPPGDYFYRIEAEGYLTEEAGRGLRLSSNQGFAIFNLAMIKGKVDPDRVPLKPPVIPLGVLSGRVLDGAMSSETGVGEAKIVLRHSNGQRFTVYSRGSSRIRGTSGRDRNLGDYSILLPAGTYSASVSARGYESLRLPEEIVIPEGQPSTRDFVLIPRDLSQTTGQGIRGIVRIADAVATDPLPSIQLRIVSLDGRFGTQIEADRSGQFQKELLPGRYEVTAHADGFPETASGPLFVMPGRFTTTRLMLRGESIPQPETSLDILVTFRDRKAVDPEVLKSTVISVIAQGSDPATAEALEPDGAGHAIYLPPAPGLFQVSASVAGYSALPIDVSVASGEQKEVMLVLTPEVKPPQSFAIRISVFDEQTKRPLSGASVLARRSDDSLAQSRRGITDSSGKLELVVSRSGNYTLLAQARGFKPGGMKAEIQEDSASKVFQIGLRPDISTVPVDPLQPEPEPPGTRPDPSSTVRVAGFVAYREPDGNLRGVKGAKLSWERLVPGQPPFSRTVTSQENGSYRATVLKGAYQLRVEPPAGFSTLSQQIQIVSDIENQYLILVRTGQKPTDPTESLINVRGTVVTEEKNGREVAVPGAEIQFSSSRSPSVGFSERTTSSRSGLFQISLPADTYRVSAGAVGFETSNTVVRIDDRSPTIRLVLKRTMTKPAESRLNLTVSENAGRKVKPLADAAILITGGGGDVIQGRTDRLGQFSTRLPPGRYTVRTTKAGYTSDAKQIVVANVELTERITLSATTQPPMSKNYTLSVRVLERQETPDKAKSLPVPKPLKGASVSILRGSQSVAAGTTDGNGQFSATLPNGSYSIKVTASGFGAGGTTAAIKDADLVSTVELARRDKPGMNKLPPTNPNRRPSPGK
ncbi:MAG: carboxypeptidase regulatory-like domain-containing protein [Planctomyces sp.]|nr:carboxypeptidase regulatory-like domain-containing protein [Planctomyces sp.]